MKLVYIVDYPVDGNSGKHKATREKAKALKELLGEENVDFFYPVKKRGSVYRLVGNIIIDFKIFSKLLFRKSDYIVIQRVLFLPLSRALFYLKKVKVITEFHADFKEEIPLLNKSKFEQFLLHIVSFFFNLNYQLSDGIIYNHPYLKEKFDKVFKKKSIYSYNGANFSDFSAVDTNFARQQLNIPKDGIIFLFLGSVSLWHGVDYLINLFNENDIVARKDISLYIVGGKNGGFVETLKKSIVGNNISFITQVPTDVAKLYINASDFCLLPVKNNRTSPGSPLKLYDYISCGKPVITQENLHGYSDEVINYGVGYTVDFKNAGEASKRLLDIIEHTDKKYFSEHNINVAVNKVSWKERMKVWIKFANEFNSN